jgi:hypothetical protein
MGTDNRTGWERNKRTIFNEIVINYDKIRWDGDTRINCLQILSDIPDRI